MKLHELRPAAGSKSAPKRVGRGTGSGLGSGCRHCLCAGKSGGAV